MIIVFSGTGNSRYIADMLGDILQDAVVDAADCIRRKKRGNFKSKKPWVFVAPAYVSAPPLAFLSFLEKSRFSGAKEAYFITTCARGMGACPYYYHEFCKKKGLTDMGTNQVVMPQNYLVYFSTKPRDVNDALMRKAIPVVLELAGRIRNRRMLENPGMKMWEVLSTRLILKPYYRLFVRTKKFYANDACVGCGKCTKVCLFNNVELVNERPKWGDQCTHCMACINVCPKAAIQYGKSTAGKPRYYCEKYNG